MKQSWYNIFASMKTVPEISKGGTQTQWFAATEVLLMSTMLGSSTGWIAPFLGKLSRPDPPFQATEEQLTWVASISPMCRVIGIIVGTVGTNFLGTKTSVYICGFYFAAAWLCLICANDINIIILYQAFCGIGMGSLYSSFSIYLGEVVNANIRGTIISFVINGMMVGLLFGNLMVTYVESWIFGVANFILTGIFLGTFWFFPSTPHYLINRNKLEEAEKALRYYKGGANVTDEFAKLQEFIKTSPRVSFLQSLRKLGDPVNLKTFIMINVIYSIVQFSGTYAILEYTEVIIMAGKIEVILPSTLVTIMSAVAIPASWVAVSTSDKFGRVTMLLLSCVAFCVIFIGWGLSFHLLELGYSPIDVQWLVIVVALLYRINLCVGLNPIVPVLISEVFAPNVKSAATGLVNVISSLCVFISVKNFRSMADNMTYKYIFYFYAGLVLAIGIYSKLSIPETKGKTLQEIQEIFLKRYSPKKMSNLVNVNTLCGQTNNEVNNCTNMSNQAYVNTICEQTSNEGIRCTRL